MLWPCYTVANVSGCRPLAFGLVIIRNTPQVPPHAKQAFCPMLPQTSPSLCPYKAHPGLFPEVNLLTTRRYGPLPRSICQGDAQSEPTILRSPCHDAWFLIRLDNPRTWAWLTFYTGTHLFPLDSRPTQHPLDDITFSATQEYGRHTEEGRETFERLTSWKQVTHELFLDT